LITVPRIELKAMQASRMIANFMEAKKSCSDSKKLFSGGVAFS
jgi:hypothetical protein